MAKTGFPKQAYQRIGFIILVAVLSWRIASQAVGQGAASDYGDAVLPDDAIGTATVSQDQASESVATPSVVQQAAGESDEAHGWFIVDQGSHWTAQEMHVVRQILEHTWQALDRVGVDGQSLLEGYRFRRAAAEFVPGRERFLALVNHRKMEIVLADGAFKRLHGFYIYHELGHAADRQLERAPSKAYHRIASQALGESPEESDTWSTATGFWLRYHGRDDREEATADAFAWWVMSQAGQPIPLFPGTPVTTDYDLIARSIEASIREATAVDAQPA
jgi:hypothetical protein